MAEERKIKEIIHRMADNSNTGNLAKDCVIITFEDEAPKIIAFDDEIEANDYIAGLMRGRATSIPYAKFDPKSDPDKDNELMEQVQQEFLKYEKQNQEPVPPEGDKTDDEPEVIYRSIEPTEDENNYGGKKRKLVRRAIAVGALVAVGLTIANNAASTTNTVQNDEAEDVTQFDLEQASLDELLSKLPEEGLAKKEYQKVLSFCEQFNKIASQTGNFRLAEDGENYLEITAEEALYTSIVLNNYNEAQIREIFGARELDPEEVLKGFESVCEKVRIYSMNATEQTGLDMLINDENAKNFFHGTENAVAEFNRSVAADSVSSQFADKVLATAKDNFDQAKTVDPAVAYLTSMTIKGYEDANVNNPEFLTYSGSLQGTTGISVGETSSDVIAKIDSQDYLSSVRSNVESSLAAHNAKIVAELSGSRSELVEALKANGDVELANEVAIRTDLSDLEDAITSIGGDIGDLYLEYQEKVEAINPAGIPTDAIISKMDQQITSGKDCDLVKLEENRIRDLYEKTSDEIVDTNDNGSQMSGEETPSTETKEEDKTVVDNEAFESQYSMGKDEAIDYVRTPGAYKYDGDIQPEYMDRPYTDEELAQMTPSQIWEVMHMAGIELPNVETDEQLQQYVEQASNGQTDAFKEGVVEQLQAEISLSKELGEEQLNKYEDMYNEAQNSVDQLNQMSGVTYVQGENLTSEQAGATATVVDDTELLELYDDDVVAAASELVAANMDYYGAYEDTNSKVK